MKIEPNNVMALLLHRAEGNPANTIPIAAISNCFPGLEFDFRQFWRRAFVGLVLLEWDNLVVDIEDPKLEHLRKHRLFKITVKEDSKDILKDVLVVPNGPVIPGGADGPLTSTGSNIMMEWGNLLALVRERQGAKIKCFFSKDQQLDSAPVPTLPDDMIEVELEIRKMLDDNLAPAPGALQPGELTQGLCSPWQHDYRECACYYWPATRPDYVNVEPGPDGVSHGDNWMAKERTGNYVEDDRRDSRMITYVELFRQWERMLKFQVRGRDAERSS